MQLVLTTIVAAAVVASPSAQHFLLANWALQLGLLLLSMLGLIPVYMYRHSHPTNLILLGCWTPLFSGGQPAGRPESCAIAGSMWCLKDFWGAHCLPPAPLAFH